MARDPKTGKRGPTQLSRLGALQASEETQYVTDLISVHAPMIVRYIKHYADVHRCDVKDAAYDFFFECLMASEKDREAALANVRELLNPSGS